MDVACFSEPCKFHVFILSALFHYHFHVSIHFINLVFWEVYFLTHMDVHIYIFSLQQLPTMHLMLRWLIGGRPRGHLVLGDFVPNGKFDPKTYINPTFGAFMNR